MPEINLSLREMRENPRYSSKKWCITCKYLEFQGSSPINNQRKVPCGTCDNMNNWEQNPPIRRKTRYELLKTE